MSTMMETELSNKSGDEGYTSPSETEDDIHFNYRPEDPNKTTTSPEKSVSNSPTDQIPWDLIGCEFISPKPVTSWDDVTIPFRHNVRLYRNQNCVLPRAVPKPVFLSDSIKKSADFVDLIWKENLGRSVDLHHNVLPTSTSMLENSAVSFMKNAGIIPIVLLLKEFIDHIFHLLSGRESISFVFNMDRDCFERNPVITISGLSPTAIGNYCKEFIIIGSLVRKLRLVSSTNFCNIDSNTLVFSSFLQFVSDYLRVYEKYMMNSFNKMSHGLVRLKILAQPFYGQIRLLYKILENNADQDAFHLLLTINNLMVCERTPELADLLRSFFQNCAGSYLRYVSDWMYRGKLGPASEFHILRSKSKDYYDKKFWKKLFSQKKEIPAFLHDSANFIFEAGKGINLLNLIATNSPYHAKMLSQILVAYDTDIMLDTKFTFQQLFTVNQKLQNRNSKLEVQMAELSRQIESTVATFVVAKSFQYDYSKETKNFRSSQSLLSLLIENKGQGDGHFESEESIEMTKVKNIESTSKYHGHGDGEEIGLSNVESSDDFNAKFNPDDVKTLMPTPYSLPSISKATELSFKFLANSNSCDKKLCEKSEPKSNFPNDSVCLNYIISQSILAPSKFQHCLINQALLHHFIVENKLLNHLDVLHNYMCLQNGIFADTFSKLILKEVSAGVFNSVESMEQNGNRLESILNYSLAISTAQDLEHSEIENLSFSVKRKDDDLSSSKSTQTSAYEILNSVILTYAISWPLNMILTDEVISHYQKVFSFLMRLVRSENLLLRLTMLLKLQNCGSQQLITLQYYRFNLLHFVRSVRTYVNVIVIQSGWAEVIKSIRKAETVDQLLYCVSSHIKRIMSNCLLSTKAEALHKILTTQLAAVDNFCSLLEANALSIDWKKGEQMSEEKYKECIKSYLIAENTGKFFVEHAFKVLKKGFYPKVAYFLELCDFNKYFSGENK